MGSLEYDTKQHLTVKFLFLISEELYFFIPIIPKFTLTRTGSTCYLYGSDRSIYNNVLIQLGAPKQLFGNKQIKWKYKCIMNVIPKLVV